MALSTGLGASSTGLACREREWGVGRGGRHPEACLSMQEHGRLVVRSSGISSGEEREREGAGQHERGSGRKVASCLLASLHTSCFPTCTGAPTCLVG